MDLNEIISRLAVASPESKKAMLEGAMEISAGMRWIPSPGPQTEAYFSPADLLLYGGEPGGGKGLHIHTPIPTPYGYTSLINLRIGDTIFDKDGAPCRVTFKSGIHLRDCYSVRFSDGSELVADDEHLWLTRTRRERLRTLMQSDQWRENRKANRSPHGQGKRPDLALLNAQRSAIHDLSLEGIRNTCELSRTLCVGGSRLNHSIDVAGALDLPEAELLIDPYVLGAWLGDGTTSAGAISGIDEGVFQEVANAGYVVTRHRDPVTRGVLGLQSQLRMLGLIGNKHIPPAYLRASEAQRLALLQGLMDTDGHADLRGQCEFVSVKLNLIQQMRELLCSLGIKCAIREGKAKLNGRVIGPKYAIKFLTEKPAFRLPRKLIRQKRSEFRGTHDVRYIVSVERVSTVPTQCIQVDSPSKTYLAGDTMVPTHNTSLLLGLAFTRHKRTLILRRQYTDLGAIVEDMLKIHGSRKGYNGSAPPSLRINADQLIELGAAARIGDEQHFMGNPHDLIGFDEGAQFAETQVRLLMGWLRTVDPKQRTRVVIATNPPLSSEGSWLVEMFAPWLDPRHPHPAVPGDLRWFITDEYGQDKEVEGPDPVEMNGRKVQPLSRTYIPSSVSDNPYLANSGYQAKLDALTEPYRSILLGQFHNTFRDDVNQCIPTAWVKAAQARWRERAPIGVPMCAMGVDVAQGGDDETILACRYDDWFAPLISKPGRETPLGKDVAGLIVSHRRDNALVIVDMGGGYGGSTYEHLTENNIAVRAYKGMTAVETRTRDRQSKFTNKRTEAYWRIREALDPGQEGGATMMLPDDPKLTADLTAPRFEITLKGVKLESKEDVCARLGRSTDRGDAVVMAWSDGPKFVTDGGIWLDQRKDKLHGRTPSVVMGRGKAQR